MTLEQFGSVSVRQKGNRQAGNPVCKTGYEGSSGKERGRAGGCNGCGRAEKAEEEAKEQRTALT